MSTDDVDRQIPIRLQRLRIENYKLFESLELEFPEPRLPSEYDMFGLGSRNGLGKTCVLEAIALTCFAIRVDVVGSVDARMARDLLGFPVERLIRFDADYAELEAEFVTSDGRTYESSFSVGKTRRTVFNICSSTNLGLFIWGRDYEGPQLKDSKSELRSIFAENTQPFLVPPFSYFHSYRRLAPSHKRRDSSGGGPGEAAFSFDHFKNTAYNILLAQSGLFEEVSPADVQSQVQRLNELLKRFANVKLGKLRRNSGSGPEIRVESLETGKRFALDGLSSGEKALVSMLFLVWKSTRDQPGIILIDEPELHMNPEWHREFMSMLQEIAPENQYIMATHSEDIFSFFDADKRIRLKSREGET